MLPKKRRERNLKKKLLAYFLLLFLCFIAFLFYLFFSFKKPLFVSPIVEDSSSEGKSLENLLRKANIPFTSVDSSSGSFYTILLKNGSTVKLSLDKEISAQISSLQRILKQLTIEGKEFKSIDFSFEKPIISYE